MGRLHLSYARVLLTTSRLLSTVYFYLLLGLLLGDITPCAALTWERIQSSLHVSFVQQMQIRDDFAGLKVELLKQNRDSQSSLLDVQGPILE